MPTVGVLITYYNEGELLRECLDSLLGQEATPDEVLIYDDASSVPARDHVLAGAPVEIIRGDANRGPAFGRNLLLQRSQCDFVHFHDTDDLFQAEWCRRVRQSIADTNADLILAEVSSYSGKRLVCERVLGLERLVAGDDLIRFCLRGSILTSASVCRRAAALAIGGYRESLRQSEDFDYHVRLAASGVTFTAITQPLIVKQLRDSSHSTREWRAVWTSIVESVEMLASELPAQYRPDLAEKAAQAGSVLFKLGARAEAREAFKLADELGPPTFSEQRRLYRTLAKTFGAEAAERVGMFYRSLMPRRMRTYAAEQGW